jgi:hypothetical protein
VLVPLAENRRWLFATAMGMGGTMRSGPAGMSGHMGGAMQGGAFMWWSPTLVSLVIGLLLYGVSRPVGRAMASGLANSRVESAGFRPLVVSMRAFVPSTFTTCTC